MGSCTCGSAAISSARKPGAVWIDFSDAAGVFAVGVKIDETKAGIVIQVPDKRAAGESKVSFTIGLESPLNEYCLPRFTAGRETNLLPDADRSQKTEILKSRHVQVSHGPDEILL